MTSLKSVRKRRQQLHARGARSLVAFCFYPLEEKEIVNKSCFQSIFSGPDKHAELLKNLKPLVKKLKFSTLVAKSDLRFKVH